MEEAILERFRESIKPTDACWLWSGDVSTDRPKRPILWWPHKPDGRNDKCHCYSARKLALIVAGFTPIDSKPIHTTCGNNLCINPKHLVWDTESRFWSQVTKLSVDNGGCWIWTGDVDKNGYGKITVKVDGRFTKKKTHRYSFELRWEMHISSGTFVCHTCDHPSCVNPDHLFLGTPADNSADRNQKGRQAKGEKNGLAKLTEVKVKQMRELKQSGMKIIELSHLFGVGKTAVAHACSGKTWKHITQ